MINLPFIFYIAFLVVFALGVLAVVYHLWAYRLNIAFSAGVLGIFLSGVFILIAINFALAEGVNWQDMVVFIW